MISDSVEAPDVGAHHQMRVAWSRGAGCRELAAALGSDAVVAAGRNWSETCVDERVDLLVTRRLPSFDLVSVAVPVDLDLAQVGSVAAAIGGGPHSDLAATVACGLADALAVTATFVSVYRDPAERGPVSLRLDRLSATHPASRAKLLGAPGAQAILDSLEPDALLVVGAPGGSWLQRQFFGPGHRLAVRAPAGAVVVRHSPRRAFHEAGDQGLVFGPHMAAGDALNLSDRPVVPVAEEGRLVGVVRMKVLRDVAPDVQIGSVMERPVSIGAAEPVDAARELRAFLEGAPVPVVDDSGRLIGWIS